MLSLSWIATLQHDAARSGPPKPGPRHFAKRMLSRRAKRLTHVDKDHLTDTRRHRLRIDGKKLRYLAEFMAGLYTVRGARRYLQRLAALQTVLGDMNDSVAMQRCIAIAAASLPARQRALVLGMCREYVRNRAPLLAKDFDRAWGNFVKARAFWG
jgi:CHAD domain-containing protein